MKKYLKCFIRVFISIIVISLILSLFLYLDVFSNSLFSYLELLFVLLILYFNSKSISNRTNDKYYLEGVKLGGSYVILFIIINIILGNSFSVKLFIYYVIILLVSILGSMRKSSSKKNN